jgi:hypothetical protein
MSFLIISYGAVKKVEQIDKSQLGYVKDGTIDSIINLDDLTFFDAETNSWKEVPAGV